MVVDKTKNFLGDVRTKDIRQLDEKKGLIKDVMHPPILSTNPDTDIVTILKELKTHSTSNVPVIDEDGKLCGLITKSSLVSTMSAQFIDMDEEGFNL